jgi:signal transduction histidine kinase
LKIENWSLRRSCNQQPVTGNRQPATGNRQPATSNQQPATCNMNNHFIKSTFWRFFLAIAGVIGGISLVSVGTTSWLGHRIVHQMQEEAGYTLLRNVADMISQQRMDIEAFRQQLLNDRKQTLEYLLQSVESMLKNCHQEAEAGRMSLAEAQKIAKLSLRQLIYGNNDYIFVVNEQYQGIIHPDPGEVGNDQYNFRDADGVYFIREMIHVAKEAAPGSAGFTIYRWHRKGRKTMEPKLSASLYFKPWGWIICSGVYIGDIEELVKLKEADMMVELRATMREIVIGKTGYIYVLDEAGSMISHPILEGVNISDLKIPSTDVSLYSEIKRAAEQPWGSNFFHYLWDHPQDRGHYVYENIARCTREPITGWYVGTSVYMDEIEAPMRNLVNAVLIPAVGAMILLGIALYFLLRNLLKPVKQICDVTAQVSKGDMTVRAEEEFPGEIGFLCREFNEMIRSLILLRENDERQRKALADLNADLEGLVAERTRELAQKAQELEEANQHLRQLDRLKSGFLSSVSHELRTPLTSVLGFAKLIRKDFLNICTPLKTDDKKRSRKIERIDQNLGIIINEGERLTRLINGVLDLARIESGRIQWNDTVFSVKELIEQSMHAVTAQFAECPEIELAVITEPNLPRIRADRDRILQVLINLLNNAAKFTDAGKVEIKASLTAEQQIRFDVQDTGTGIPKDDLEKVFDKFHQVVSHDTLKDKPRGTGLGLSISRHIIEHYGGKIWADSELGKGTTFSFTLPVPDAELLQQAEDRTENILEMKATGGSAQSGSPAAERSGETPAPLILVVDDDPSVCAFLAQIIEDAGYQVTAVRDGQSALEIARKQRPDLITVDIMMPGMDGNEVISRLREHPELKAIPIVVISVLPESDAPGGDATLSKPIDEKRLIGTLYTLLNQKNTDIADIHPCMIVTTDGVPSNGIHLYCPNNITNCSPEEMWEEINKGFQGIVLVPADLTGEVDIDRLARQKNILMVIFPEFSNIGGVLK